MPLSLSLCFWDASRRSARSIGAPSSSDRVQHPAHADRAANFRLRGRSSIISQGPCSRPVRRVNEMEATPREILERNREAIESLCRRFGVARLLLFGSTIREDWVPATSDFDFLAEFGEPPPGVDLFAQQFVFQTEMEQVLGRPVDIVDWRAAKKPIFRQLAGAQAVEWYAA